MKMIRAILLAAFALALLPGDAAAQGFNADYLPFSKDICCDPFP